MIEAIAIRLGRWMLRANQVERSKQHSRSTERPASRAAKRTAGARRYVAVSINDFYRGVLVRLFRCKIHHALHRPTRRISIDIIADQYQMLLHRIPRFTHDETSIELLREKGHARKSRGSYYTPLPLVDRLLRETLDPILARMRAGPEPATAMLNLRICDPACGAGHFLVAAARRIAASVAEIESSPLQQALRRVIERCIFGVDLDPIAVDLCRAALMQAGGAPGQIVRANALLDDPEIFGPGSFDLIIGNPPFSNAIEAGIAQADKPSIRRRHPLLGGTSDVAYYFLDLAAQLIKPGGVIAMVMPRAVLSAPSAAAWRTALPGHLRPNFIYAPQNSDLFGGAAVFICLLALGPNQRCRYSVDPDPAMARWQTTAIAGSNWWAAIQSPAAAMDRESPHSSKIPAARLSEHFDVRASMTTGDAYDAVPHLVDRKVGAGMKIVTTGLIDPGVSLWGQHLCRYLKRDYRHPRMVASDGLTRSLQKRLAQAQRPKIIVAGLTKGVESFVDVAGEYIGTVSTYSIFHPRDDVSALHRLNAHLLSDPVGQEFVAQLGSSGMRGAHITMTQRFLKGLPIPDECVTK